MWTQILVVVLVAGAHCVFGAWDYETKPDRFVDLGFAVDRHQSIDQAQWEEMMDFIANFAATVGIEEGRGQMGLVSFDEISTLDIHLNEYTNTPDLQWDIRNQTHGGFGRDISLGIYRLRADLFLSSNGDNAMFGNVGILITNGKSDADWAKREANIFRNQGGTLVAIGVGSDVDDDLLTDIAGDPANVLTCTNFNDLTTLTDPLRERVARSVVPPVYCPLDACIAIDRHVTIDVTEWGQMLDYVSQLAWLMDIEQTDSSKVGVVSYGVTGTLEIGLGDHTNFSSLNTAIMGLPHTPDAGGRALDQGLRTVRINCFNGTGDRPNIANVAILITDGDSNPASAIQEANLLKLGIYNLITIGVGSNINHELLTNLSTNGTNMFNVSSFLGLKDNPDMTLPNMCPIPPPTTPPPTTPSTPVTTTRYDTGPTKPWPSLPSEFSVDLGFAIDRHQSITEPDWTLMLQFVSDMSGHIGVDTGSRIGLVSYDEISTLDIQLDDHNIISDLQNDIIGQSYGGFGRDISLGLYRLRADLYTTEKGDQSKVRNIAILITNGESDFDWAALEAQKLRDTGATIITIGVGPAVNSELLLEISNDKEYMFTTTSFATLSNLQSDILAVIYGVEEEEDNTLTIVLCCVLIPAGLACIVIAVVCGMKHHPKKTQSKIGDSRTSIGREAEKGNRPNNAHTNPTYESPGKQTLPPVAQGNHYDEIPPRNATPVSVSRLDIIDDSHSNRSGSPLVTPHH